MTTRDSSMASALLLLVLISAAGLAAQSRDARAPAAPLPPGTATISGIVTTDGSDPRPLRRATVRISEGGTPGRVAITDDEGRFVIQHVRAGRYQVSAAKPAYVSNAYGATRMASPDQVPLGTAIAVADGEHVRDVVIRLTRGSVIGGTIRDPDGQPARSVSVRLLYSSRSYTTGERTLVNAPHFATTDDRGTYRIFGVRAGAYVVIASPSIGLTTDVRETTDADVRQARAAVDRPGAPMSQGAASSGLGRGRSVGFVPVYFPGTPIAASAAPVTLGAGEERLGVDFQVQLVQTARIEGRVTTPDGLPASGASLRLAAEGPANTDEFMFGLAPGRFASAGADGTYRFAGVAPGAYRILARSGGGRGEGAAEGMWALSTVSTLGEDVKADLQMRPGLTISGRVVFDAKTLEPPADVSRVRVSLSSLSGFGTVMATVDGSSLTLSGVIPGPYRLTASMPGGPPLRPTWMPKSAMAGGRDALDGIFEVEAGGDTAGLVVTFTDHPTELAGTIVDATGRPAPDYFLIAFTADRARWRPNSRRIQQTRPGHDGKFSFLNLPAGDYLLAAVTSVEQNQWFDPEFLAEIAGAAVRVTLAEGERTVQDLRVR